MSHVHADTCSVYVCVCSCREGVVAATNWKELREERVRKMNPKKLLPSMPVVNSSVAMDMSMEVRGDSRRQYHLLPRAVRCIQRGRRPGRPVTEGTSTIWLRCFTVGLNGGREEVVDEPNDKNRKRKIRRMQAHIRAKKKKKKQ